MHGLVSESHKGNSLIPKSSPKRHYGRIIWITSSFGRGALFKWPPYSSRIGSNSNGCIQFNIASLANRSYVVRCILQDETLISKRFVKVKEAFCGFAKKRIVNRNLSFKNNICMFNCVHIEEKTAFCKAAVRGFGYILSIISRMFLCKSPK
jgi:hypothetical protein